MESDNHGLPPSVSCSVTLDPGHTTTSPSNRYKGVIPLELTITDRFTYLHVTKVREHEARTKMRAAFVNDRSDVVVFMRSTPLSWKGKLRLCKAKDPAKGNGERFSRHIQMTKDELPVFNVFFSDQFASMIIYPARQCFDICLAEFYHSDETRTEDAGWGVSQGLLFAD
jgi:hypothetical protein